MRVPSSPSLLTCCRLLFPCGISLSQSSDFLFFSRYSRLIRAESRTRDTDFGIGSSARDFWGAKSMPLEITISEKKESAVITHRSSLSFSLVERLARLCGIFCVVCTAKNIQSNPSPYTSHVRGAVVNPPRISDCSRENPDQSFLRCRLYTSIMAYLNRAITTVLCTCDRTKNSISEPCLMCSSSALLKGCL